jgi:hypothetical protein
MNEITPQLQLLTVDSASRSDRPCADPACPSGSGPARALTALLAKAEEARVRWRVSRLPAGGVSERGARDGAADDDVQWAPLVALPDLLIPILLTSATEADRALFARRLHDLGGRRHGPFVAVQCRDRSPEEIDLALFGDDSWDAAAEGITDGGAVVAATGGTLYIDEISRLSLRTQAKLLHAPSTSVSSPPPSPTCGWRCAAASSAPACCLRSRGSPSGYPRWLHDRSDPSRRARACRHPRSTCAEPRSGRQAPVVASGGPRVSSGGPPGADRTC